jgi:hypothetical protein
MGEHSLSILITRSMISDCDGMCCSMKRELSNREIYRSCIKASIEMRYHDEKEQR